MYSIVKLHIGYSITIWGYALSVYITKVLSLQNRVARIIRGVSDFKVSGIAFVSNLDGSAKVYRIDLFYCKSYVECDTGTAHAYSADCEKFEFSHGADTITRPQIK